jgi:arabinose-5-phosphate isomerase
MTTAQIISAAKESIETQYAALQSIANHIDDSFAEVVELIHNNKGRVIVSGIGKSGIIAQKIVATFNSTGTPSIYMHAADAIHGDLGMMQPNDIIIIISKSGESDEIKVLASLVKKYQNTLIAICGKMNSSLALEANYVLDTTVAKEACPNNLAPTTSTTAQMVMGDALAICLLLKKGFSPEDFARFHPGGTLGKQLYLHVGDLSKKNEQPYVTPDTTIKDTVLNISANRLGATAVLDNNNLVGIITDGDIRRMLQKDNEWYTLLAKDVMNANPKTIQENELAITALETMRQNNIAQLVVLNNQSFAGFIHLHDLLREGLV